MAPVAKVTGCADCPLCAVVVTSWGYERSQAICQHQDGKTRGSDGTWAARDVAKEDRDPPKKPPRWCPLRSAHYLVQLRAAPPAPPTAQPEETK